MSSIVIKLPNWMGDILFSYDLLYSLSKSFERLGVLTSSAHGELFEIFPLENTTIIDYPPQNWPQLDRDTLLRVHDFHPDCGLLLTNSFGSALVLRFAGVPRLMGYSSEKRKLLLGQSIPLPAHRMHQKDYYLNLLKIFELQPLQYPINSDGMRDPLVVIHPGASKMERAWNMERFLKVAERLSSDGFEVIFVTGDLQADLPHAFRVARKPSLKEFAEMLKKCALFIGNDSGPLHLAQQCGASVLGIYGPGDPFVTGPRPLTPYRIISHRYPCSPCHQNFFKECEPASSGKPFCIDTISSREVIAAALDLLKGTMVPEYSARSNSCQNG
jgi:heptosyltransferase II